MNKDLKLKELQYALEMKMKNKSVIENKKKNTVEYISYLIENNLDQAKLIIASQDVIEKLQKIAERLAELNAEEIMPLSDSMKAAFGQEISQKFEHVASESIQKALEAVRSAKDAIDDAVLQVEGKISVEDDSDMAQYKPTNDLFGDDTDSNNEVDSSDDNNDDNGEPLLSIDDDSENDGPLGRELKDYKDYVYLGKKAINEGIDKELISSYLKENTKNKSKEDFNIFSKKILESIKNDRINFIGSLYSKKLMEQNNRDLIKVRAIASIIESNVRQGKPTKVSEILSNFVGTDLTEESSINILTLFNEEYGCTPAIYSARLKRNSVIEDTPNTTGAIASQNTFSKDENLEDKAMANIASKVANNPSFLNQPIASATSDLSAEEKTAINDKITSNPSINQSTTVKDFLQTQIPGTQTSSQKTLNC